MKNKAVASLLVAAAALGWPSFAVPAGAATKNARALSQAKAEITRADYQGDLETLLAARDRLRGEKPNPKIGYLVDYWAGFAGWRYVLNARNQPEAEAEDLNRMQLEALEDFESSAALEPNFADAHAGAAAMAVSLLGSARRESPEAYQKYLQMYISHLRKAKELGPSNPRVKWVEGGITYWTPAEFGGSQASALAMYREALEMSKKESVADDLLPDWGEAEAHMSLAWTYLYMKDGDPKKAKEAAETALELRPDWYYVREVLLPSTEAEQSAGGDGQ